MARRFVWLLVPAILGGCTVPQARGVGDRFDRVTHAGVIRRGPTADRAARALARLRLAGDEGARVAVVDADGLDAWAWADGRIVVTRGLVDGVGEPALVAAIAHELGHLVLGGHLDGGRHLMPLGRADDERAADGVARMLLARAGLTHTALTDLLGALHAAAAPASIRRARLASRLEALAASSR